MMDYRIGSLLNSGNKRIDILMKDNNLSEREILEIIDSFNKISMEMFNKKIYFNDDRKIIIPNQLKQNWKDIFFKKKENGDCFY